MIRQMKKAVWIVALVMSLAMVALPATAATTLSVSGILGWFAGPSMEAGAADSPGIRTLSWRL